MVDRPHIFLASPPEQQAFTTRLSGRDNFTVRAIDQAAHAQNLIGQLRAIWAQRATGDLPATAAAAPKGTYVQFESAVGYDLLTQSLEDLRSGIRLLNVKTAGDENDLQVTATIFVPAGKEHRVLKKIEKYGETGRSEKLVANIEQVALALVRSFWQDRVEDMPGEEARWCEIWLRTTSENSDSIEQTLRTFFLAEEIECQLGSLKFPERTVVLAKVSEADLELLISGFEFIAEFRRSKERAGYFVDVPNREQAEWVEHLRGHSHYEDTLVSVCILDTGANSGHPLLLPAMPPGSCIAYNPTWGTEDHHPHGHGTAMCGLGLYGDMTDLLQENEPIFLRHRMESVKILPPGTANDPLLWGHITTRAVSSIEISFPRRQRVHCMAITADNTAELGRPTSWSAAIDQICLGQDGASPRLFLVSAGNVDADEWVNYPDSNYLTSVGDPGQSWNALTVGAITHKDQITEPPGYTAIAPLGGLSPYTATSTLWNRKWPIKPEIVLEGGNAGHDGAGFTSQIDDLSLLTTSHNYTHRNFTTLSMTSAATAEASRMAALVQCQYPNAWPETIRALMVHSAAWPDTLKRQLGITDTSPKTAYIPLLRAAGYGVPDLRRALHCANNSLTLIAQETIQPYDFKEDGSTRTKDMHLYELPWPRDVLLGLGATLIELKITLSYFIEPGPGEIGWKHRYRYPSFGLRFDLNAPGDNRADFLRRLNAAADADDNTPVTPADNDRWLIGSNSRHLGSVHSDKWIGTAADIATCNLVGIYPVIGWWRERKHLGKVTCQARYSLVVSLHTPAQEIDIYTPVQTMIENRTPIAVTRPR